MTIDEQERNFLAHNARSMLLISIMDIIVLWSLKHGDTVSGWVLFEQITRIWSNNSGYIATTAGHKELISVYYISSLCCFVGFALGVSSSAYGAILRIYGKSGKIGLSMCVIVSIALLLETIFGRYLSDGDIIQDSITFSDGFVVSVWMLASLFRCGMQRICMIDKKEGGGDVFG